MGLAAWKRPTNRSAETAVLYVGGEAGAEHAQ